RLQRRGVIRPQLIAQVELDKRLLEPLELMQENAALIGGLPMPRVELKSMLKAQERIGRPIERDKNAAGMLPQVGIVRPELHRLVEHVARVVEAPHLLQGDPERRKIVRLASLGVGSLPDSAR